MAILTKDMARVRRTIDLDGPDGNAWALMGTARNWGKQLGWSREKIDEVIEQMMSDDYENLIRVFDSHFGHIADLIRSAPELA